MANRLNDRVGIVTAAASGMGRAGAIRFAAEGAAVAVVDRDTEGAERVVEEIVDAGGRAIALGADLRSVEASRRIVDDTAAAFGKLDFVWNHLGHPGPGRVEGMSQDDFDIAVDLNMRSVFATTEAAIPAVREAGGGAFVFTSSTAGVVGSRFSPVYSAMKHGVVGYVKALALRLASENIRVNAVCPGPIETPMFGVFGSRPDSPQRSLEEVREGAIRIVPLGRIGQPEEVANAALFLLSDEASFVTGVALPVDGGFSAG
jgi:NAD(P)-dependent dehydrogenase (short-subunit alcohol dehydrogenase family)